MRSVDGCPDLQLDTDPVRPAKPPSSSPCGDASKSESDFDRLRMSPRSVGLDLKAATGADSAEAPLESITSAFEEFSPGAHSAIVLELKLSIHSFRAAV